jgi:hypothetical protein
LAAVIRPFGVYKGYPPGGTDAKKGVNCLEKKKSVNTSKNIEKVHASWAFSGMHDKYK